MGGSILISRNNIKNAEGGKITLKDKDSVVVIDTVKTDNFNFDIPANATVTIKLMDNMNIDNENSTDRSAINLNDGSTLNLYIYGNTTVNSSYGVAGANATGDYEDTSGGAGAKAGIHVPETATLNLYGTGTLTAIGGDAGKGGDGDFNSKDWGGAGGGRSWSWNWWKPEEKVGDAGGSFGYAGDNGEKAGNININTLTVYAFGGHGGSGGSLSQASTSYQSGGGGGGYPAAGIGGGRSWRNIG